MCGCCSGVLPKNEIVDHISFEPFDIFHAFPSCSLPSPSLDYRNMSPNHYHDMIKGNMVDYIKSLGTFQGFVLFLNPHNSYLEDLPRKIMWSNFFHHSSDFSKTFDIFG